MVFILASREPNKSLGGCAAQTAAQGLTVAALETRLGLHEILQEATRSSLGSGGDEAMRYQMIALSLGLSGITLLALPVQGQGHGGRGFAFAGPGAAHVSRGRAVGRSFIRMHHGRRAFAGSGFGPNYYPYYDSADYYPDYDSQDEVGEAPPAPFRAQTAAPASPAKPPESLVMELRGDHWVRLTSHGPMETSEESSATESGRAAASVHGKGAVTTAPTQPPSELPPAVLVFRDGHQEEVAKYTIIGTTISIKTDYWSTGSWTRKIPIAELNLSATLQANQERGAKFSLPSRPSEVIVR